MDCCRPETRTPSTASIPEANEDGSPDYRQPEQLRECKDVLSLMVFSVFAVYMLCVAIAAASRRDYARLLHRSDSFGNLCGFDNRKVKLIGVPLSGQDMRSRKLLEKTSESVWMCVEKCPKEKLSQLPGLCPAPATELRQLVLKDSDAQILASDFLWQLDEMSYVVLTGIGFTVLWMLCLRFWINIYSWLIMMASALSTLAFTTTLWLAWDKEIQLYEQPPDEVMAVAKKEERSSAWLVALILLTILTVVTLLMIAAVVKKASLVVRVLEEAGRALGDVPALFLQAALTAAAILIVAAFWLLGLVAILSVVHPFIDDSEERTVGFETDGFFLLMSPVYALFFLWLANIVISCQHFVVASSVASWYFTRHKTQMSSPVMQSVQLLLGYHLGSVVFGSLLLVLADPLRALVSPVRFIVSSGSGQGSASLAKFLRPFCNCLDRSLMYVSKQAYIVMAMRGLSFRTSGRRALRLLRRHCQHVSNLQSVAGFLLFLAKSNVALLAVFSGLWIITESPTTVYVWAPLMAAGCVVYYVADSCISLYEVAIDTLFLCFCEDCEQNNGVTRPFFVTDALKAFMTEIKDSHPDIMTTPRAIT